MLLRKQLEFTELSIKYDAMIRECNHKHGADLDIHRESMDRVAEELKRVRNEVERLRFLNTKHD